MRAAIDAIKQAISVADYAARFLTVNRGTALCPWHREKTPSLKLHAEYYKCHGCGAGGDLIAFAAAFHGISTGAAIRMLADEFGIPLTRQPAVHPYDAAKAARIQAEATEWYRRARVALIASMHADDYDRILPFLEMLESMTRQQILESYQAQRTPAQAALFRQSIRESDLWVKAMTPLIGTLVDRMASAPETQFHAFQYGARCW